MDLNAPLGTRPPSRKKRKGPWIGAAAVIGLTALGFYLIEADPHGGEPYAVAVIPPPPDATPTGSITPRSDGETPDSERTAPGTTRVENGVKVVTPGSSSRPAPTASGPLVIDVSKALDAQARRTAKADGRLPADDASPPAAPPTPAPRIAIFISGLGLDKAATSAATASMPAGVVFAFVPYGDTIRELVGAARSRGHEILLQVPMQGADGTSTGPHTLRVGEAATSIDADLTWMMGRFDGFDGVTNLLGAPVTADQTAMTTILRNVGAHGLYYLDDGTSPRSVTATAAASLGVPLVRADIVLDATGDPAVVRANLDRLVALARAKGTAIGMASGLSDHLALIARFAGGLDAQGLALVPVSTIANGGANVATTR